MDSKIAARYVGFRNLDTGLVWIAFANYVTFDEGRDLGADEMIAPHGTLEAFLNAFPSDTQLWKPTISEAVAIFVEKNPGG
ncbi:hypothetical protein [Sphingopyxis macrogoltabida]|uniref:hypothetical protein n=1 Tax=Sphingopyxis macrogoltabida TaxID=33050 RepID=UPI0011AB3A1B|nr:hypothetical protein [Sphingopyxis macrogoltabida]